MGSRDFEDRGAESSNRFYLKASHANARLSFIQSPRSKVGYRDYVISPSYLDVFASYVTYIAGDRGAFLFRPLDRKTFVVQ